MREIYVVGYDANEQDKVCCPGSAWSSNNDYIGFEFKGIYYCRPCNTQVEFEHFNTHIKPNWLTGKVVILPEGSTVFDAWKEIPDLSQDHVTLFTEFEQTGGCTRICPECGKDYYVEIDADFKCKCGYQFTPLI